MEITFDPQSDLNFSDVFCVPLQKSDPSFHETIFFSYSSTRSLISHRVSPCDNPCTTDRKTQTIVSSQSAIMPMKVGGNVSADVTVSWGGKGGVTVSGGASGEVHDNHGNYAKGEVKQDSNGEGTATVSTGHKSNEK